MTVAKLIRTLAAAAVLVLATSRSASAAPTVAIVKSSTLAPFEQAVQAIVSVLSRDPLQPEILTFDLDGQESNGPSVLRRVRAANPVVIVTVGSLATAATVAARPDEPVVFSMVLYPEQSGFGHAPDRALTGASLDLPVELQFRYVRQLLPAAKRIGVLYDPSETGFLIQSASSAAEKNGFTLIARPLTGQTDAVKALETMLPDVDLVWAVADSHVFTPQTTSALVLSTLHHRVPLIGLSTAHVRAGALAALYCDYSDVGAQAGEAALRILHGEKAQDVPVSSPRRVGLALNLHTAEHLGVQIAPDLQTQAKEIVR